MRWNASFMFTLLLLGLTAGCRGGGFGGGGDTPYIGQNPLYAQCHIKVIKGTIVTWENHVNSPEFIPAGTALTLNNYNQKIAYFTDPQTGKNYQFYFGVGNSSDHSLQLIHKYLDVSPPAIDPGEFQQIIDQRSAKEGMNREHVYYSMGPPAWAGTVGTRSGQKTYAMDKNAIMQTNKWVYERGTWGKNVGIEFDANGVVTRTEGIFK